ncbi:MAG: sulfite exporter TauE/SafE family protein [Deltaproteobacteria bacterium]|nr:MAG: sulfite exporter TauE/SafE family protein [Deltaproteobacteria bacterium]
METYLLICAVIFFAGFTQGLSGFGSILLAIPLLAMFLHIKTVIPFTALMGMGMTTFLLIQLWRHLSWKKIMPYLIGTVPGIPLGVLFLKKMDKGMVQLILGTLLISYSVYSLLSRTPPKGTGKGWGYVFGFLGGCLGGAFSASGPAVIVYASLQDWPKDRIKASLQGMFFVSGSIVVFFYALNGFITADVLKYFGVSLPALVFGTYVGSLCYGKISDVQYRKVMFVLLGLLGAFLIYRS